MYGQLLYKMKWIPSFIRIWFYLFVSDASFGDCQPRQQPDGLVAGSLDLVTMLLKARMVPFFIFYFYF